MNPIDQLPPKTRAFVMQYFPNLKPEIIAKFLDTAAKHGLQSDDELLAFAQQIMANRQSVHTNAVSKIRQRYE